MNVVFNVKLLEWTIISYNYGNEWTNTNFQDEIQITIAKAEEMREEEGNKFLIMSMEALSLNLLWLIEQ